MNVLAKLRRLVNGVDDFACEVVWVRRGEAHAANARNGRDFAEQRSKVQRARRGIAVGVDCLAEKLNLAVACVGKASRFSENGVAVAAAFGAAGARDDTV